MNINEYRNFTGATRKEMGSAIENSIHFVLGVSSELLSEYYEAVVADDKINMKEELGDANWFLSEYANNWDLDTPDNFDLSNPEEFVVDLVPNLGKLLDLDKGEWVYGKKITKEQRQELLTKIWIGVEALGKFNDFDTNEIRKTNIKKLKVRFGDKFDEYLAKNRDLAKELEVLSA